MTDTNPAHLEEVTVSGFIADRRRDFARADGT